MSTKDKKKRYTKPMHSNMPHQNAAHSNAPHDNVPYHSDVAHQDNPMPRRYESESLMQRHRRLWKHGHYHSSSDYSGLSKRLNRSGDSLFSGDGMSSGSSAMLITLLIVGLVIGAGAGYMLAPVKVVEPTEDGGYEFTSSPPVIIDETYIESVIRQELGKQKIMLWAILGAALIADIASLLGIYYLQYVDDNVIDALKRGR